VVTLHTHLDSVERCASDASLLHLTRTLTPAPFGSLSTCSCQHCFSGLTFCWLPPHSSCSKSQLCHTSALTAGLVHDLYVSLAQPVAAQADGEYFESRLQESRERAQGFSTGGAEEASEREGGSRKRQGGDGPCPRAAEPKFCPPAPPNALRTCGSSETWSGKLSLTARENKRRSLEESWLASLAHGQALSGTRSAVRKTLTTLQVAGSTCTEGVERRRDGSSADSKGGK